LETLPRRRTSLGCLWEVNWLAPDPLSKTPHCINRCKNRCNLQRTVSNDAGQTPWISIFFYFTSSPTSRHPHPSAPTDWASSQASACLAAPNRHHVANHRLGRQIAAFRGWPLGCEVGHPLPLASIRSRPSSTSLQLVNSPGRPMRTAALDRNLLSRRRNGFRLGHLRRKFPHGEATTLASTAFIVVLAIMATTRDDNRLPLA
jgi:hypothetical protein